MRFNNLFNSLVLNILVFSATGLVAQSVTMSNEITMVSDNNYDLIGYFNNKITLLEDNGRSLTLHEFDDNLKNINTPNINDLQDISATNIAAEVYIVFIYKIKSLNYY